MKKKFYDHYMSRNKKIKPSFRAVSLIWLITLPCLSVPIHGQSVFGDQTGIGTLTPVNELEIKKPNPTIFLNPTNWVPDGYGELKFGDGNHYIKGIHSRGMLFNDIDGFSFMTPNKFGIGTQYPQAKFHVLGADSSPDGKNAAIEIANGAAPGGQWMLRVGAYGTNTPISGLSFANNSRYVMAMTEGGSVGIGVLNPEKDFHLRSGSNDHIALFENTNGGGADGIAIKLNQPKENLDDSNRFISFMRSDNSLAGRVEGYQYDNSGIVTMIQDLLYVMGIDGDQTFSDLTNLAGTTAKDVVLAILNGSSLPFSQPMWSPGSLPSASFSFPSSFSFNPGSLPSLGWGSLYNHTDLMKSVLPVDDMTDLVNGVFDINQLKTRLQQKGSVLQGYLSENPAVLDLVTAGDPWGLAIAAMTIEVLAWAEDDGVSYASKGADYAEWLPKADPEEQFMFGQIVGVKDGKISKSTTGADQIMVVSQNPIVLGNMIAKGEEADYEKVGFMGQVPVQVIGKVEMGDYIIASGMDNGFGMAISPDDIKLEHFTKIVGRAWSDSELPMGVVNVAIGLKTNEWVSIMESQEKDVDSIKKQLARANIEKDSLQQSLASLKAEVSALSIGLQRLSNIWNATRSERPVTIDEKRP